MGLPELDRMRASRRCPSCGHANYLPRCVCLFRFCRCNPYRVLKYRTVICRGQS